MKRFSLIAIIMVVLGFCFTSTASATLSDSDIEKKIVQFAVDQLVNKGINVVDQKLNTMDKNRFVHTQKKDIHYVSGEVDVLLKSGQKCKVSVYLELKDGLILRIVDSGYASYLEGSGGKYFNDYRNNVVEFLTMAHNFGALHGKTVIVRND